MRALHIKLLRDLRRLWAQALAIALVMAAGVATLIIAVGAHDSLLQTRTSYYEANGFVHMFSPPLSAPGSTANGKQGKKEPQLTTTCVLTLLGEITVTV